MSAGAAPEAGHWFTNALLRNWSTKALALILALVVFVMTRDEVTRTFRVPLEVAPDPDRVLLTDLPDSVEVEVRAPWAKMAKLKSKDLGAAFIDLGDARPGPLQVDPASIVMPEGVVLSNLVYETVDLRFEAVIERELTVVAHLVGEIHADYERVTQSVSPDRWTVRGPEHAVEGLTQLDTESVSVTGATESLDVRAALILPAPGLSFVATDAGHRDPEVRVRIELRPRQGERELEVPVAAAVAAALGEARKDRSLRPVEAPAAPRVQVQGPVPALRELASISGALEVKVEVVDLSLPRARNRGVGSAQLELDFAWGEGVDETLRSKLSFDPREINLDLAIEEAKPVLAP